MLMSQTKSVFNNAFKEEDNHIQDIGKSLIKKIEYMMKFKQPINNIETHGFNIETDLLSKKAKNEDPMIQYFLKCK